MMKIRLLPFGEGLKPLQSMSSYVLDFARGNTRRDCRHRCCKSRRRYLFGSNSNHNENTEHLFSARLSENPEVNHVDHPKIYNFLFIVKRLLKTTTYHSTRFGKNQLRTKCTSSHKYYLLLQGFQIYRGSKSPFSHWLCWSSLQQCCTACDYLCVRVFVCCD